MIKRGRYLPDHVFHLRNRKMDFKAIWCVGLCQKYKLEILAALNIEITVLWGVMLCSLVDKSQLSEKHVTFFFRAKESLFYPLLSQTVSHPRILQTTSKFDGRI
jgi:hypothetical protein